MAMWQQRQRLEWASCKPRNSKPPEARKRQGVIPLRFQREHDLPGTLTLNFWPPQLRDNKFLCFQDSLWCSVMAALGSQNRQDLYLPLLPLCPPAPLRGPLSDLLSEWTMLAVSGMLVVRARCSACGRCLVNVYSFPFSYHLKGSILYRVYFIIKTSMVFF